MIRPKTEYIVIHCSATRADADIGAKEIREWHLERGWSDIGYHYVIRRDGVVERGRNVVDVGAHAKGYNRSSVAVCMVGGVDDRLSPEDNFTEDQWWSLEALVDTLNVMYPDAEVLGHRDLPGVDKACPCFDVKPWYLRVFFGA